MKYKMVFGQCSELLAFIFRESSYGESVSKTDTHINGCEGMEANQV